MGRGSKEPQTFRKSVYPIWFEKAMLKRNQGRILSVACVLLIGVMVMFELPKWAVLLTMIAPVLLLADVYLTWKKGNDKK